MTENEQRLAVVAEARSWLRTPWHHNAGLKGVGVDCANLPAMVYPAVGVVAPIDPGEYAQQWHMNRKEELFIEFVKRYAHEIEGPPLPGDLVLFKFGLTFSHGEIVVEWPLIIHAHFHQGVVLTDIVRDHELSDELGSDGRSVTPRPRRYFTLWSRP